MASINELLNEPTETGDERATPATGEQTAEEPQDSPETSQPAEKMVPLQALEDERRKRQSYEQIVQESNRRADALLQLLQSQQQSRQPEQSVQAPDFLLNNEEWQQDLFQRIGFVMNKHKQESWVLHCNRCEEDMRDAHSDYDQLVDAHFKPALVNDPTLLQRMQNAANPARFAYREAKKLKAAQELGDDLDIDKIKSKIEAEVRAKVLAEIGQKQEELKQQVKLPASLEGDSGSPAVGSGPVGGQWRARDLYGSG